MSTIITYSTFFKNKYFDGSIRHLVFTQQESIVETPAKDIYIDGKKVENLTEYFDDPSRIEVFEDYTYVYYRKLTQKEILDVYKRFKRLGMRQAHTEIRDDECQDRFEL